MTADVEYINGQWRVSVYRDGVLVERTWFFTELAAEAYAEAART